MSYDLNLFNAWRRLPRAGCGFLYEHRWETPTAGDIYTTPDGPRFDMVQRCPCGASRIETQGLDARLHPRLQTSGPTVYPL